MTSHINYLVLSDLTASDRATLLRRTENDLKPFIEKVKPIIDAVRTEGDTALSRFAEKFDGAFVEESAIAATPEDFDRAHQELETDVREAIVFAAANIRKFHELQTPEASRSAETRPGLLPVTAPRHTCRLLHPRGKGSFASSVLRPAFRSVAGVEDIAS